MRTMKVATILLLLVAVPDSYCAGATQDASVTTKPHIIFIIADDAGWNDFSFHGSYQIPTPNIDALCLGGVVLKSYYSAPLCTPSRGATLTGKHPIHIRLQHYVIMGQSAEGLPLEEKLLSQYLKEMDYSTHIVGKWHLGHAKKEYTPTFRGFDSHLGYWLGKQDYYDHTSQDGDGWGYDFRANMTVDQEHYGEYNTEIFTNEAVRIIQRHGRLAEESSPLFLMINHIAPHSGNDYDPLPVPQENLEKFNETISDINRRHYAGIMDTLDESVGSVVEALFNAGMLENSIIVFASDNGGAPDGFDMNYGSNWPLRGAKNTLWEGGTRLAACIWSPIVDNHVMTDMMRAEDWLPTLYEAAGGEISNLGEIDGMSMWQNFLSSKGDMLNEIPGTRSQFLYNIDDQNNNSAIRIGPWKLIQGNISTNDLGGGNWDDWFGPSGRDDNKTIDDMIQLIIESKAAQSIACLGTPLDPQRMKTVLKESEISCEGVEEIACDPYNLPCLFNIDEDPCEKRNLASEYPEILEELQEHLKLENDTALTPIRRYKDPRGLPVHWDYLWINWMDHIIK